MPTRMIGLLPTMSRTCGRDKRAVEEANADCYRVMLANTCNRYMLYLGSSELMQLNARECGTVVTDAAPNQQQCSATSRFFLQLLYRTTV